MPTALPDIVLLLLLAGSYLLLLVAVYRALQQKDSLRAQGRNVTAAQAAVTVTTLASLYFAKTAITGFLLSLALLLLIFFVLLLYLNTYLNK
ncbi:hypothetical protein FVR03_03175 [Pontibacter qinzhouensis]|uniref:Uncharacterized protein n=1 Tax=Pontibacter qinzhouensis TaxID=2603253 RepID=A0A5C8KBD3_9BACT|nr:hypothetical protein [Pontibacter qinzhouensis]TXK51545.1 hypothetical protein FVR03_03175 [Pontibacter qinzhouensis]